MSPPAAWHTQDSLNDDDARDRTLVARLHEGDADAFREIFQLYAERLVLFARSYVHSDDTAEDIIHDMFTYLWIHRHTLEVRGPLRTYLYKGVRNRVINTLRDSRTAHAFKERLAGAQGEAAQEDPAIVAVTINASEMGEAIKQAVAALPERTREVWCLNRDDSLSYTEIAQVLDLSVKTVETHMSRALKALRVSLAQWKSSLSG